MKIGVIQMTSGLDPKVNLKKIRSFLEIASNEAAEIVFLPEAFYSFRDLSGPTPYIVEKNNEHFKAISCLASDYQLAIMGGSAATLDQGRIYNRAYQFGPDGNLLGIYDKQHLFSCDFIDQGERKRIDESEHYCAGQFPCVISYQHLKIGISLCFDLRYSPLFWNYKKNECDLISVSSAFTVPTGQAHWHTLLKARAIETQSYVVASAQWGTHESGIKTFGHSLVVDPWGHILVDATEGEKIVFAKIDALYCSKVRNMIHI